MREALGNEIMREYWDSVAKSLAPHPKYSRFGLIVAPYWKLERRLIAELSLSYLLPISRSERLLLLKSDLWNEGIDNSSGHICDFVEKAKRTVKTIGMDISPVVCNSAKRRMYNEELMVVCADVKALPFRSETIDIILDVSTLDHIPPTHIAWIIDEYVRTLKEGGILTLIFDSAIFWWLRYLQKIFNRLRCKEGKGFMFSWRLSPDWIKSILGESGFTILNEYPLGILSLSPFFLKASQSNLPWRVVPRLLYGLIKNVKFTKASKYLFPFSSQYLFVARKQRAYREGPDQEM